MTAKISAIFFDFGDTLGTAVLSADPIHLAKFHVFDFVPGLLSSLRETGIRLGVISNTGDDDGTLVDSVLAESGLLAFFENNLRIYS